MIFKNFFKPKWQHNDPTVRIEALKALEENSNYKSIMHELAFNDATDSVRLAALEKLNDFSLWWQCNKNDPSERLKKISGQIIEDALLGKIECKLDSQLKSAFLVECNTGTLIETIAFSDPDEQIRLSMLQKLEKPHLYLKAILDKSFSEVTKLALLDKIEDDSTLDKIIKKGNGAVSQQANEKRQTLLLQKEKPKKIKNETLLVLSKLKALKDKSEYEAIRNAQSTLLEHYSTLQTEFDCLGEEDKKLIEDKYNAISTSIASHLEPIEAAFLNKEAQLKQSKLISENELAVTNKVSLLNSLLKSALESDVKAIEIEQQINELQRAINNNVFSDRFKVESLENVQQLRKLSISIDDAKRTCQQANVLLAELESLIASNDSQNLDLLANMYNDWKSKWHENQVGFHFPLPDSVSSQYKTLKRNIEAKIKSFSQEENKHFQECKKKLREFGRLVDAGKYRASFGVYKKVQAIHLLLTDKQKLRIEKEFTAAELKVSELEDWQDYISSPRRQEILLQVEELVKQPFESIKEQAEKVKYLRGIWNSLGKANLDEITDNKFNDLIEKAFSVCREHYSEQEKLREENRALKTSILTELEGLLESTSDNIAELDKSTNVLFRKWRDIGHVPKEVYADMQSHYKAVEKKIKTEVHAFHSNNRMEKEAIIKAAQDINKMDDANDKVAKLKLLQAKWKTIGFCGKSAESQLWTEFRHINDEAFAARDEVKQEEKVKATENYNNFLEVVYELEQQFNDSDGSNLDTLVKSIKLKQAEVTNLSSYQEKDILSKYKNLLSKIDSAKRKLSEDKRNKEYENLFKAVLNEDIGDAPIKAAWKSAINREVTPRYDSRLEATIALEIVAGVETSSEESDLKKKIQLDMMTTKLQDGVTLTLEQLLIDWLAFGFVTDESGVSHLERIQKIFK